MLVDFHVHSTASDGTRTPAELAGEAARQGFVAMALTDHDNCHGIAEFTASQSLGDDGMPRLFSGIELSIEPGEGFDRFHLLGLGVDPQNAGLQQALRRILEGRQARNERIRENFQRLGIDMPHDPRSEISGDIIARPHYAQWLVKHGYADTFGEAFAKYLLPESPLETRCYEERWHPPQEATFKMIHDAGGLCIMAHPRYWKRCWTNGTRENPPTGCDYRAASRELAVLKEKGLDGIESIYQANTSGENVEFMRLAAKHRLLQSAGSDYHGANKPMIQLGMYVGDDFIAPLLERLRG